MRTTVPGPLATLLIVYNHFVFLLIYRLPVQWLGNGKGQHADLKSALWSLRDLMLRDALNIKTDL